MTITKRAGSVLFAGAAAAAMVALTASSALAATTLTVKVTGGGNYSASATTTVLTDGHVSVTCVTKGKVKASTASGKITNGTVKHAAPVKVGTAAKLAFNNCSNPLTGKVTTTTKSTPYAVNVDSTTNSKGQTDGIITGINVAVKTTGCSFNVKGTTAGFYTNSKHTLTMTTANKLPVKPLTKAQLTVSGVVGCAGLVKNNDHPTYVSTYQLNTKTTITSK
jgi:hypothetical protein